MRSFGLVFWISEESELFNIVWEYAVNLFKQIRSAESVMFWYILLGKLGLLANLYEKDMGQNPLHQNSTGPQSNPFHPLYKQTPNQNITPQKASKT